MEFKHYQSDYYEALHAFLIALGEESPNHLNWNWARLEWMFGHPDFDTTAANLIGLWMDRDQVVAAAIYDMEFGEAFCGTLKKYESLYPEVLAYAFQEFQNASGLGVAICEDAVAEIEMAKEAEFTLSKQRETMLCLDLSKPLEAKLPKGLTFEEIDYYKRPEEFQWLMFRGFDHGEDREEFKKTLVTSGRRRPHFDPSLSIAVKDSSGDLVGYCGVWYVPAVDYAYVEPVCVIPSYRKKGIGKAVVYEALRRAKELGAKKAYVLSDQQFYIRLGFRLVKHYFFYWKKAKTMRVNKTSYRILRLLGKGKGGYSYLAENGSERVVVKHIHHEPCSYYNFSNKIESEQRDYQLLVDAGIRIPKMIDIDLERECIVKEFFDGPTIFDMLARGEDVEDYLPQVRQMAALAKAAGLNIDYFPTNFIVINNVLYYIDYECNPYMDEWSFERWAIRFWARTPELEAHIIEHKKHKGGL